jgi:hypothetical protein
MQFNQIPGRIYEFIDSNLQVAAQYLPLTTLDYGNAYPGRLTKGSANALWAQTYLFRQDWAKVIALCTEVINSGQYSLLPEFSDIWREGLQGAGKNSRESIFEMNAAWAKMQSTLAPLLWDSLGTSQQIGERSSD